MQAVVITGASTGIGLACARAAVGRAAHVFGSVRRAEDGVRVQGDLGAERFTPLVFDVTDEAAVRAAAEVVRGRIGNQKLFGLVNNAGIAVPGPLVCLPVADFRRQLEVNMVGVLNVTQAFAGLLGMERERVGRSGRIINMSSVAGRMAVPFIGAYAASKHGLEAMTDALRRELVIYGIDAIAIGPRVIETPIWDKAEAADLTGFASTEFWPAMEKFGEYMRKERTRGLPAERVGELVWKALSVRRPRARYAIARGGWLETGLPPKLPKRLVDWAMGRWLGLG